MGLLREYLSMTKDHWIPLVFSGIAGIAWIGSEFLGWKLPRRGLLSACIVCLFVAQFLAFADMRKQRDGLKFTFGPRIDPVECASVKRSLLSGNDPVMEIECLNVVFQNRPDLPRRENEARSVIADVTWLKDGNEILRLKGRWGDSEQPRSVFSPTTSLDAMDFGIGVRRELNLAIRSQIQNPFFAFNNESYGWQNWERPEYRLADGAYMVSVALRGVGVDSTYLFDVRLDTHPATITPAEPNRPNPKRGR